MAELAAYAALSNRLAGLSEGEEATIGPDDFPTGLTDHTDFGGLVIDTAYARQIGWAGGPDRPFEVFDQTHGFEGFAEPEGFRRVGLWLLHLLLSERDWVGLRLTHPTSRARAFYAEILRPMPNTHRLKMTGPQLYASYDYEPQQVWRHPFASSDMSPVHRLEAQDRPFFGFGWSAPEDGYGRNIRSADQIILRATPEGIAAMACVLIDMAHPTLGREEINMEPPDVGFAGTQPRSLEARFWLPGTLAFPCDRLEDLTLPPWPQASSASTA